MYGGPDRADETPRIRQDHPVGKLQGKGRRHLLCARLDNYQINDTPDLGTRAEGSGERKACDGSMA
ncbi:hypothetical protein GCM10011363_28800 [Marivita lacus]|uniref:Transposase n=1 Tax=Marivita lacus TaxID=1323742 RepID=A0ABQ1KX88_9RHOB|nr:hypothetical protein GCM10011363_28800 [Marivita lacus]